MHYSVTVGNRKFEINEHAYALLKEGDTYTIYFPRERPNRLASIRPDWL